MAQMFPEKPRPDNDSEAEIFFYWELKNQLSKDFVVMHGVRWFTRDRLANNRTPFDKDGEIDFLIVHPRLGLLVVEVKGGTIDYDGETDIWTSTSRNGVVYELKRSPFSQAMRNMYALHKKLQESPLTKRFNWHITRAVAFPEINTSTTHFGPDALPEIVLDARDIENGLQKAIIRAYGAAPTENFFLGKEGVKAAIDLLAPTFSLPNLALSSVIKQDEQHLIKLTERQFRVLGVLKQVKRVKVAGCAGSGKTMLAMQKARSLARDGFKVIYTCFNSSLARWVENILVKKEHLNNVIVAPFHQLCFNFCQQAGVPIEIASNLDTETRSRYYDEILPERLIQAIKTEPEIRFDALVVDEGQDMAELWWIALEELLIDPATAPFYIFYDDNQKIYHDRLSTLPTNMVPATLQENCRNTQKIHQSFLPYYRGETIPICEGPQGLDVMFMSPSTSVRSAKDEANLLRKMLYDLTQRHAVKPNDIVVLTCMGKTKSPYNEGDTITNIKLTWNTPSAANQVHISTIKRFKGLESPVIIVTDIGHLAALPREERANLIYVALSRAKHQLILLANQSQFSKLVVEIKG